MDATTDDMIAQAWPTLASTERVVLLRILILGALRPAWPDAWIAHDGAACLTSDDDDPDGRCYVEAVTWPTAGAHIHHPAINEAGRAWLPIANDDPAVLARRIADLLAPFAGQPIARTSDEEATP